MTILRRLNPRLHLAAAIGWAVFAVVTLAGLIAANLAAARAEDRARADAEGLLAEFAIQVRDAVSMNLQSRRSVLQATAAQILASRDGTMLDDGRRFAALQSQFPEFVWLGAVDGSGRIRSATEGLLVGVDVKSIPWFVQGSERPFVSESHAPLPAGPTGANAALLPELPLLDFAVPLDPSRPGQGVIAAFVRWSWVEQVLSRMQDALSKRRQIEVILAGRDGTVLVGPTRWLGKPVTPGSDLTEGGSFSIGTRTQLRLADGLGLGWTAIVRQKADLALEPVRSIRRTVFLIVFLAGVLAAGAAAMVARVFTRRLSLLAQDAEAVRNGQALTLGTPVGADEVSRIGRTLLQLVDHLQTEKQALRVLNSELDRRVAERTLRIERMAEEARHAAVTRERFRIARDLHDTLAHSMMALLTQIRLIRKLHARMARDEFDAELDRAETVAATGLSEARAAITQMRDNGVHDTGLGPALGDLARRFTHRTGVACSLEVQARIGSWADDRAETVFRIVEEALRNVERHARATSVRISLRCSSGTEADALDARGTDVVVDVTDDGIGFDTAHPTPGHYGLLGMQEQAALISARFQVVSEKGRGTRVALHMAG